MNIDNKYKQVHLFFDEEQHKYTDNFNNNYISTTTILHQYQKPFDKNYWLKKKAKELGISERQLENQWKTITDEACSRGSKTHDGLEQGIKGGSKFEKAIKYLDNIGDGRMITVADLDIIDSNYKILDVNSFIEHTENKYPKIYDMFNLYTSNGYKLYAEIGVFNVDYLISGMIDVLALREDKFCILDWKTNRGGLKFTNGYYKKDKTVKPSQTTNIWVEKNEKLLPPVNNMPDCNGSIYNLQLSMYAKLTELILGIPCVGLVLCHIDSDFELNEYGMPKRFSDGLYHIKENPVEHTTFHVMPYRKNEIEAILKDRKMRLKANEVKTQFELEL